MRKSSGGQGPVLRQFVMTAAHVMGRAAGCSFGPEGRVQGACGDECGAWPVGAVLGLAVPVGPVRPVSASVRSRWKRRPTASWRLPSPAIRWAGRAVRAARRPQTGLMFRPGRHARCPSEAAVPPDGIGVPANGDPRIDSRTLRRVRAGRASVRADRRRGPGGAFGAKGFSAPGDAGVRAQGDVRPVPRRPSRWRLVALLKAYAAPMAAEPVGDAERLCARGVPPACPSRRLAIAPWRTGASVRLVVAVLLVCGAPARDAAGQQPSVTLAVSPATLMEDSGGTDVRVTATLSASRSASTAVTLSLGGEARPGGPGVGDYTVSPASPVISIPAGSTEGSVTLVVNPVDDTYWEQAEEITVDGSANGVPVTGDSFVIEDDEQAPGLEIGFNSSHLLAPGERFVDTVALRLTGDSTLGADSSS